MATYDFIFIGAGCAGLSMVHYLLKSKLKNAKILLIDTNIEIPNKTWCYWSESPLDIHPKENLISWDTIYLESKVKKIKKTLGKLNYYHLTSKEFYTSIRSKIENAKNITQIHDEVINVKENGSIQLIETKSGELFEAKTIFDSRIQNQVGPDSLKQIFLGWKIKSTKPCFNPDGVTLMNFAESIDKFDFFYILPYSETEALVEYTMYSNSAIEESILEEELKNYLQTKFQLEEYEVSYKESGSIPMTTSLNQSQSLGSSILKIGTGAGWIKASTGYGFYSIQKKCESIVTQLEKGNLIQPSFSKRFDFYDNILLNIAHKWPHRLQDIFLNLFETSSTQTVLRFLSEETRVDEDLKILSRLKFNPFIKSLLNYERH